MKTIKSELPSDVAGGLGLPPENKIERKREKRKRSKEKKERKKERERKKEKRTRIRMEGYKQCQTGVSAI